MIGARRNLGNPSLRRSPQERFIMLTKRDLLKSAAAAALVPLAGPALADWRHGRPGFLSAKDIAEQGYIFGLPIVMNYGVMYEFTIDKTSSQYKAPFNAMFNEARVFTYEDTAVVTPNSDTPYSMLWLDLRAEPIVISEPLRGLPLALRLLDARPGCAVLVHERQRPSHRRPRLLQRYVGFRIQDRCSEEEVPHEVGTF
jgi:hypothetical protein